MSILADHQIYDLCTVGDVIERPMISPFVDHLVREDSSGKKVLSYGLSSFGYDLRSGGSFKYLVPEGRAYSPHVTGPLDPLDVDQDNFMDVEFDLDDDSSLLMEPHSFVLCHSLEYIVMPDDVFGIVQGKSSYARCGIHCLTTPLEPGWEGQITLEFANLTGKRVMFHPFQGCAQVSFYRGVRPKVSYADRKGKYQGQTGVTFSKA